VLGLVPGLFLSEGLFMSLAANVVIHPSQFPAAVSQEFARSLRERKVNHKFHYDSIKQTQKWLSLHQAYSPSRTDENCAAIYDQSFTRLVDHVRPEPIHLIGLGCGGGQKDSRLLGKLSSRGCDVHYTPMDVSVAMVLVARLEAMKVLDESRCHPFVCDLAESGNLYEDFDEDHRWGKTRIYTFFGMIPNFEPGTILPKLAALVSKGDHLLFSANLAPGPDYSEGVRHILPLYDNALTAGWLETFLFDLGVGREDGEIRFSIESDTGGSGLQKVVARFHFFRGVRINHEGETFDFNPGESIQLFFSYRHTPESVDRLLTLHGLTVKQNWLTKSGEEGVFYCVRD
jgi:uncharacterized SAM-dependent methyltransferase